ncbi:hypothetical protein ACPUEX_21915 [Enterobacter vonholyi]|nr:hypothetical protein [Enterobacter asburiae]AYU97894.1 hypothetical protein EEI76_23020 [Enterobacter cloacae]MCG7803885.1 hypothetical protein [Enterobacter asburiae]UKU09986.1 hypothetical protein [Enterobacter asburiae]
MSPGKERNRRQRWTLAEMRYVEQHYGTVRARVIAEHLGRPVTSVRTVAGHLGCSRKGSAPWTEEEKDIIRTHYARGEGITRVMTLLPGRTRSTIFAMAAALGVTSARSWSREELRILKAYYTTEGTAVSRRLPGRTPEAVKIKAHERGLTFCGDGLQGRQRMWQPEELALLKANLHLEQSRLARLFPGRSLMSVKKARERLRHHQKKVSE